MMIFSLYLSFSFFVSKIKKSYFTNRNVKHFLKFKRIIYIFQTFSYDSKTEKCHISVNYRDIFKRFLVLIIVMLPPILNMDGMIFFFILKHHTTKEGIYNPLLLTRKKGCILYIVIILNKKYPMNYFKEGLWYTHGTFKITGGYLNIWLLE